MRLDCQWLREATTAKNRFLTGAAPIGPPVTRTRSAESPTGKVRRTHESAHTKAESPSRARSHTALLTEQCHTEDLHTKDLHTTDLCTGNLNTANPHTDNPYTNNPGTDNPHTNSPRTKDLRTQALHTKNPHRKGMCTNTGTPKARVNTAARFAQISPPCGRPGADRASASGEPCPPWPGSGGGCPRRSSPPRPAR